MKIKNIFLLALSTFLLTGCSFNFNNDNGYLYIAHLPNKTHYHVGDTLNLDKLSVLAISSSNSSEIADYTSNPRNGYEFISSDVGNKQIVISKTGYKSTSFTVEVTNEPRLEIDKLPDKLEYIVGDRFSLEGLVISSGDNIISDYTCNLTNKTFTNEGKYEAIISKDGYYSVSFMIEVLPALALVINHLPNKTSFNQGDLFTSEGLIIFDNHGNTISDYELSLEENSKLKYKGEIEIIISKEGYASISFKINVSEGTTPISINKDLNIYYINDTHGSFIRTNNEAGMAYIGDYIINQVKQDKLEDEYSLVLSGGDMFQGGFESNETFGDIMIDAMNIIGFDAMTLGNHEFDWGEEYLKKFASKLECPIISSNVFYKNGDELDYISPYVIINRDDLKIGVIGALEDGIATSITGSVSDQFSFENPNSYIKYYSNMLRKSYGCDVIIASLHDRGYEDTNGSPTKFNDLTQIDEDTNKKYVDAMFFAHDHRYKKGTYNDVPYLETGSNGKYIGVMSLNLNGDGYAYSVDSYDVNVYNAVEVCQSENEEIAALSEKYASIIGDPDEVIYNFKNNYSSDDFTNVVCEAMYWYVNDNPLIFDNTTVYFSSHNTGGVRSNIYKGTFTRRDLIKVFPFDNFLTIQTCTERNIREMRNSSYYRTYEASDIIYVNGVTKAVSITYISEYRYAYNYQQSYIKYDVTAKEALYTYLKNKINPNL